MKVTLNLGNIEFDFADVSDRITSGETRIDAPMNNTKAKLSMKDVTVTFEASVEETLADIQATTEVMKELKNLASEFGNLFAKNEESRREKSRNDFESVYDMTRERITEVKKDIENEVENLTSKYNYTDSRIDDMQRSFEENFRVMQESIAELKK